MGKAYRIELGKEGQVITSNEMRNLCQRPGKMDENQNPIYTTEQSHKDQCNVNKIIAKYDREGIIRHVSRIEAKFGDLDGKDFKDMQDQIITAKNMFMELPSEIRNRFKNDPAKLLEFMEDSQNRDEAIKLGLIDERWTPETDGLGEHVKEGENVVASE
jgi:phage internal scaffolding protein